MVWYLSARLMVSPISNLVVISFQSVVAGPLEKTGSPFAIECSFHIVLPYHLALQDIGSFVVGSAL